MKQTEIMYGGKIISTNDVKSDHWTKVRKYYKAVELELSELIRTAYIPKMKRLHLSVRFRSRHDTDNVTPTIKIFVDQIVRMGKLPDDNNKRFDRLEIEYDPTLPHNTMVFLIKPKNPIE